MYLVVLWCHSILEIICKCSHKIEHFSAKPEVKSPPPKKKAQSLIEVARSRPIRLRLVLLIFDHAIYIRQFVGVPSKDDTAVEVCSYQFVSQAEHLCRGTVFKALLVSLCPKA